MYVWVNLLNAYTESQYGAVSFSIHPIFAALHCTAGGEAAKMFCVQIVLNTADKGSTIKLPNARPYTLC